MFHYFPELSITITSPKVCIFITIKNLNYTIILSRRISILLSSHLLCLIYLILSLVNPISHHCKLSQKYWNNSIFANQKKVFDNFNHNLKL